MLLNNQLYSNLDLLVNTSQLLALKTNFDAAIVRNWHQSKPTKYSGPVNFINQKLGIVDYIELARKHPSKFGPIELIQQLDQEDLLGSYLRYQVEVSYNSLSMNLRYTSDYLKKDDPTYCHATNADQHFDFFYNWLDQQNIFCWYGRVVIFLNEPGIATLEHRDLPDNTHGIDEFIWINLDKRKRFYVVDPDSQQRVYINNTIAWFNTVDLHGAEPVDYATYSIRVDGRFTDHMRKLLKI